MEPKWGVIFPMDPGGPQVGENKEKNAEVSQAPQNWSSLFQFKQNGKLSSLSMTLKYDDFQRVSFKSTFLILQLITLSSMELILVGKFLGLRPKIEVIQTMVKGKGNIKGQVDIVVLPLLQLYQKGRPQVCSFMEPRKEIFVQLMII